MLENLLSSPSGTRWKLLCAFLFFFSGIHLSYAQADFAIQGAAVSPTSVAVGSSIYATGSIYNIGSSAGSSSNIGYYLSTNNTLDNSDVFIGSSSGGNLNEGATSSRNVYLTIPTGTATGSYYLLFVADYLGSVKESNENNNVSSVSIAVVPSSVDFSIYSAYLYSTSVTAGSGLYVEGSIYNQGNIASTSSSVGFYLSTNSTYDASDVFIGSYSGSAISPSYTTGFSSSITIPSNTTPGTYYIVFVADYLNSVTESNETNNTLSRQFTVTSPSIDLIVQSSYLSSSTLSPGNTVAASCYVYNQGNTAASSSNVGFYLSTNTTLDNSDTFIGSSSGSSLAAGSSSYRSVNLTIPSGTAVGSYYILFAADYLNSVTETNESNNVNSLAISVVAPYSDLYIESAYLYSTSATPGSSMSGQYYIYNLGNVSATSSNVGIYLSTNTTYDASDVFVGSSTGGALAAGSYSYRNPSFTIPSNTTAGNYYVLFVADYLNTLTESNEKNNTVSMPLAVVLPSIDLALESAAVTASSVSAGNPVTVTATVRNYGNTSATSSNIGYYLSTNNTLDAADVLIGFANGSSVYPESYEYRSTSVTIPSNTTPGNYYLIQAVDYLNVVKESNENNNTSSTYMSVTAQGTTFVMPSSGNSSFTTCSGKLYDNGGTGPYTSTSNSTLTLSPAVTGNKIQLSFLSFALYYYDYLEIYDGTSTSATLIGRYSSSSGPAIVTASNASGALTLRFYGSGYYYSYSGFEADISCVEPAVDLTLLSAFTSASSMSPGTSFTTNSFVANIGTTSSPSSAVGYYLSANSTFESTDVYLGNTAGGLLTSGTTVERKSTLSLPSSTTAGNYNLLFVADANNDVEETNEKNNVRTAAITVNSSNYLDLEVTAKTLASTSVTVGSTVNATATIKNNGNVTAPKNTIGFYLSSNTTFDENDVLLVSKETTSTLTAAASEVISTTLTIPSATTSGSYYILFVSDPENHIVESNETNGVMSSAITVTSNSADLVVKNGSLSASSLLAGGTVTATATLENQGTIAAASSNLSYYLSTNKTFEAADVLLGTTTGSSLASKTSASKTASLTIPAGTAAGTYYILFVADPANAVTEGDETNNIYGTSLTIVAPTVDLLIQTPALSVSTIVRGNTLTATSSIKNDGTVSASASTVSYYLSTNNTYEAGDVSLGTSTGGTLAASTSASNTATLTIPATTAAGNYFILFVADPTSAVTESNENNNLQAVALTVTAPALPDLVASAPTAASNTFIKGAAYSVSSTITNQGNASSTVSSVGFYLSANDTWDANDLLVGQATGTALNVNATSTLSATVTIPTATAAGAYKLIAKADYANTVTEGNEDNNVTSSSVTVVNATVDFTLTNVTASSSNALIGSSFDVSVKINNGGNTEAASSNVGYYLSSNLTFDVNDIALGTSTGGALAAGANATRSSKLTVPTSTAAGNYYLLFVADPGNAVTESNENNNVMNTAFSVIAPTIDLALESPSVSVASVLSGGTVAVTSTIINNGNTAANTSTVGYYLSANNTLESSDIALGNSTGASLAPQASASKSATLTIPANTANGTYYILFVADHAGAVAESNEANNMVSVKLTVAMPVIDLVVQNASISPSSVTKGATVTVNSSIVNNGTIAATSSTIGYYLSTNSTYESSDVALGTSTGESLAAGTAASKEATLTIPANTEAGSYFVLFVADHNNNVTENNESNNTQAVTLTVTEQAVALSDLTLSSPAVATLGNVIAGGSVQVTGTVSNQGDAAAPATKVSYYLSSNDLWDASDALLSETSIPTLAAGASTQYSANVTIPANTPFTNYYLLRVVDAANALAEKNEANNMVHQTLAVKNPNGIKELSEEHKLTLWPNPAVEELQIEAKGFRNGEKTAEIILYSAVGQKVATQKVSIANHELKAAVDVTHLNHGMYLVHIKVGNTLTIRRIVVRK
ncbi:T9SS C-terminal target domain-containing protein [Rufibacter immobilis]|uniref:T9SS C-terminal target domain-containing protein n=1 Tax=Rufibacter immobilis TaxID=1348778 RepID=A0A3M9N2L4_9BACT|nr:CARDB domain-containing protein [Rufibacter immobilis]RNI32031.1 T9SS C-terminal target domain-containing protein [Rufibacter immobilis]